MLVCTCNNFATPQLTDDSDIDDELLDSMHITKTFVRKKLLALKDHQVPSGAYLDELVALLSSANILPEKCQAYATILAREGFDSPAKLAEITEEDLAAIGISSLFDVRVILSLTKTHEATRPDRRRLSAVAVLAPVPAALEPLVFSPLPDSLLLFTSSCPPHETPLMTLQTPVAVGEEELLEISVISLNLLADCNLQNSYRNKELDGRYRHATIEGNADVFCLQEVDFSLFHSHLKPYFNDTLGFDAIHQWDEEVSKKSKAPNHPFGVAICFRKSKYRESFRESRSRTMIVGLSNIHSKPIIATARKKASSSDWYVVCAHLEADPEKEDKRLAQLSSTLFNLSVHATLNPRTAKIVVAGDFNSTRDDAPFQWLVNPQEMTVKSKQFAPHAFRFRDVYENSDLESKNAATYADPFLAGRVDHVLFSVDTSVVMETLAVPPLEPNSTQRFGIFYDTYPSDHYPVGCLLHALPPPSLEEEEEEKEEDENITPGQMRVLEFLEKGAPVRNSKKGKPSPAELAAIKAHTKSVNVFLSHLNKSQRAWVQKWRKKNKPLPPPSVEEELPKTTKARSSSFTLFSSPVKKDSDNMFVGVGSLFGEEEPAFKPPLPRRRNTLLSSVKSAIF